MSEDARILLGRGLDGPVWLDLRYANRHGLVAGATGTGKTVTLQVLAEGFARAGIPVFLADIKGDLSGLAASGRPHPKIEERVRAIGIPDFRFEAAPVIFWDLFGEQGHPVRTTISEMGPLLLARLLGLNETQESVLYIIFRLADEQGLLLLDLADLRAMLAHVAENAAELKRSYGNVSAASVGAIQRRLLALEEEGGGHFFGEPALEIRDLLRSAPDGRGYVHVLAAERLMRAPRVYATFLLWLLAELFEELPEVGDLPKPKLVFFFDEAHLLFEHAPPALLEKVEQVVRLIRSRGVGVFFVTQNPLDVPDAVSGQLGTRIQHALRAFTPAQRRAIRAVADNFRPNPKLDVERALTELAVGETLVSTLAEGGVPTPVDRVLIAPPHSRIGPLSPEERRAVIAASPYHGRYEQRIDRISAYEMLAQRAATAARPGQAERARTQPGMLETLLGGGRRQGVVEAMVTSVARSIGSQIGRAIVRGLFGSLGRRR